MVTRQEAVCLWEDHVGDSGQAPTNEELHTFALAVQETARKPFVKLFGDWDRKAKEYESYSLNNYGTNYGLGCALRAQHFREFAGLLENRIEAKN